MPIKYLVKIFGPPDNKEFPTLEEALSEENIHRALKESCQDQTDFLKKHGLI